MDKFKKYGLKFFLIAVIICSFVIMVFAIGFNEVFMETTLQTGEVKIDLNNGEVIFEKNALNIEPNQTIIRDFTVKNIGTADCYYKVYLEDIKGELANQIIFEIYDEDKKMIKKVKPSNFTVNNAIDLKELLTPQEEVAFIVNAYLPKQSGNEYQKSEVTFSVVAEAIQSKRGNG